MSRIRIVTTRAPGLIPSLADEIVRAPHPVVLIPESFTLACETEMINRSENTGIFDLKIFSPSSLIREIHELTGHGTKKPISGDGQNMIISQLLHHHRDNLKYYRDSAAQPTLAAKIAAQIDDFTRARLDPAFLRGFQPASRRTGAKIEDVALIWDGYRKVLEKGFEDTVGQWMSAVSLIQKSGIVRNSQLLIYGFDYITHDILNLVRAAAFGDLPEMSADEVVIGLISDDVGPDRDIFRSANDSVKALEYDLNRMGIIPDIQQEENIPLPDPGISYVEKTIYALGKFQDERTYQQKKQTVVFREDPVRLEEKTKRALDREPIPDFSHVRMYYARNSYLECQHACQTLIDWHRAGVAWEDMAVAVCEQSTLPSLLPLTLSAAGIPFNAKQDQPILMSAYAQYFLSLLRILRLNFCRDDVLRIIKTGFTDLLPEEAMDMENYARACGIHRGRWLKPFHLPEKESEKSAVQLLEEKRRSLIDPIVRLKEGLSDQACTGKQAAALLFRFITDAGVYDRLLKQEEVLAEQGDDLTIDRNRQVWTAVNELLDTVATFIGEDHLPLRDLCAMLEASLSSRMIKSLPQLSGAVMVAPPQMFFSSGIPYMIVMGLQENEISSSAGILSEHERSQLEQFIREANDDYYRQQKDKKDGSFSFEGRPYAVIGQSLLDLAARQKQDVYQAVSLARRELMLSCSAARPNGGILTPSTAFSRLAKKIREVRPENCTGGLMKTDIRPFAPVFALEALAVRLRETGDIGESFLQSRDPEDRLWKNALGSLAGSEAWKPKLDGVLNGLRVTAPAGRITPEEARGLYASHGMTISRVETFSACPYRHFLQYGLHLVPVQSFAFRKDEQGTFNHDVLKMFLDKAMKLPEWPDLSEQTQTRLLNQVLKERVRQWDGGILTSDTVHRYQGAGIIRAVRTSVSCMMRSFRQKPHFLPYAAEVPFGTPDETGKTRLPAIQIRTSDGGTVAFSGRIDRIDVLETENGVKHFIVVDNKLSAKEVKQNAIAAGLQLQLPLYMLAAQQGMADYQAAGGLYQPVRDVLVGSEEADQISDGIARELRTSGIILDSKTIQDAMKPVKISRRLDTNDTVSVVSSEEMQQILQGAVSVVTDQVNRIRSGEVAPRPVKDDQEPHCARCDHPDACRYDSTIPGCRYMEIDHRRRMEIAQH